ncbi:MULTISPECIES: D-alanyl-D-alanine carboxypeptidase [unclassified Streptomyces]|uniref:D-alanyl-D-alanine carboxypeptidase n=1 Tax=unclassified Streptomyces TaxID=2593676 RepID=UPI0037F24944
MAGESPGRADQQESAGEATGRGAVDPRLAVFRGEPAETSPDAPESAPEPPAAAGAPAAAEPERRSPGTPDGGADADDVPDGTAPDAEDASAADDGGSPGESGTDAAGAPADEPADARSGQDDPDDPDHATGSGAGPASDAPEEAPEGAGAEAEAAGGPDGPDDAPEAATAAPEEPAGEAERPGDADRTGATGGPEASDAPEGSGGADPAAHPDGSVAAEDAEEDAEESDEDGPGDSGDSGRAAASAGGDDSGGPSQETPRHVNGSADWFGGSGAGPRTGEGTMTLRAPRADGADAPPREGTLTLRAPGAPAAAPEKGGTGGTDGSGTAGKAVARPAASAPAATPARPGGGTFVPLVGDDRPAAEDLGSRTKQMPLPPEPDEPLKLLAELTNTPPPVQTPLRTTVRRVKIWTPVVLLLAVIFVLVQALRPLPAPELTLTAKSSYTFEGDELSLPWPPQGQAVVEAEGLGRLGAFGEEKPVPIASVAKVMTTYVILRDHPIKKGGDGETVPVDKTAEEQFVSGQAEQESVVKVTEGQKLSEYEALEAVMLPSANNVARLLARWDAGSEKAFVKKMNAAAQQLGMKNTHYTDPSGLEATTVSTASDQVKLGHAAMKNPVFAEIATKIEYRDINGDKQKNYNQLAGYDNVVGIKTGTSTKAGGNLLFAAVREIGGTKQLIIGAMLGQHKAPIIDTVLTRSSTLLQAALSTLTSDTVIKKGDVVGYIDDGLGGRTRVVATKDVTAIGWTGLKVDISVVAAKGGIPHKAPAGTTIGTLTVGNGDSSIKVPVALERDLTQPSFGSKLTRLG